MKLTRAGILGAVLLMSACAGAHASSATTGDTAGDDAVCTEIGRVCHDVDGMSSEAHACHVSAHASWSPEECAQHRDHCRSVCSRAGQGEGAHREDGHGEHGGDEHEGGAHPGGEQGGGERGHVDEPHEADGDGSHTAS